MMGRRRDMDPSDILALSISVPSPRPDVLSVVRLTFFAMVADRIDVRAVHLSGSLVAPPLDGLFQY